MRKQQSSSLLLRATSFIYNLTVNVVKDALKVVGVFPFAECNDIAVFFANGLLAHEICHDLRALKTVAAVLLNFSLLRSEPDIVNDSWRNNHQLIVNRARSMTWLLDLLR